MQKMTGAEHARIIAAAGDIPFVPPGDVIAYIRRGRVCDLSITHPPVSTSAITATRAALATLAHCKQWAALVVLCPTSTAVRNRRAAPCAPLSAVSGHKRYNTLHFQIESRVPTGRSRPYWMTQRKAGRAVFGRAVVGGAATIM